MPSNFELSLDVDAFVGDTTPADRGFINNPRRAYWAFDDTTKEYIVSKPFRWPTAYTGTGTTYVDLAYIMASATSGTIELQVVVEAISDGDTLDLDTSSGWNAANIGTETVPATAGHMSILTITLTDKDGAAAGDMVRLRIARDAGDATNDTATGDLHLLAVAVREES